MTDLKNNRREYLFSELSEDAVSPDPFEQFNTWLTKALESGVPDPTAMVLSTVSDTNRVSSRVVLLKQFSEKGFEFYTNYRSKKGEHLAKITWASLLFFWPGMERQIRIEGTTQKLSAEESASYFKQRPPESRAGAWASPQSREIPDRNTLSQRFDELLKNDTGILNTCPPDWGGYILKPVLFEFWQGRTNRLHDRIEYNLINQAWKIRRLAP